MKLLIGRRFLDTNGRLNQLADEELMAMMAAADPDAFRVVLDRHSDAAFALAYRICGARPAAEEITQDAFLTLWRTAARYDGTRASVRTWLLLIVRSRALDVLRADGRRAQLEGSEPDLLERVEEPVRTDERAIARLEGRRLRGALEMLPREQRQAIELAYFAGFSQSEIAEMLQEPLGTIKGRMRLGLHRLRDRSEAWESSRA
ncbi:MAG: sigma-70 family RNA polymerase sigma factor [Solirubrobacteraceae bacterium]